MGGGKGQKTTTTTQVNPMQQLQMPFVEEAWKQAQNLYQGHQTPGSTIAQEGIPWVQMGLELQGNLAKELHQEWQPTVYGSWLNAAGQRPSDSPAYNYYQSMAQNQTGPQQQYAALGGQAQGAGQNFSNQIAGYAPQIAGYAGQAGANNNLGMSQLGQTAQGNYINGNPWFSQMVQNAMDPITRNFQTATAPQLDASFASSGRYGSGAMLGQRENAQTVLADQLAKTSSNMYGQNYANERQQQLAAAQNYGQLYNQGLGAAMQGLAGAANVQQGAANTYQQGIQQAMNALAPQLNAMTAGAQGLQSGYQAGLQNQLNAAQLYPSLAQANFIPSQMVQDVGKNVNALQQQFIDEPYNTLDRYLKQIGAVQGGSSSTTTPYFSNPLANAMSGITGGLGIMQQMGGMGGLGGGGGMSGYGGYPASINSNSGVWTTQPGMGLGIYTNPQGITSDVSGSGFPGIPQMASMAGNAAKKI